MARNKKKIKPKPGADPDDVLLKKLPGLLAICEFALIPFLVVFPLLPTQQVEQAGNSERELVQELGSGLMSATPATADEVQIAAIPEPLLKPKTVMSMTITAYSSTEDQTDNTPFYTANGNVVRDGIVAANFLPLGTNLRIPEVFGDKVFTVLDRMHERFDQRIDIWMPSREAAQEFGIRYLTVEIL